MSVHAKPNGPRIDTCSVDEAAKRLGIGRSKAYQSAKAGTLPALRFGRRVRILTAPLDRMLRVEPLETRTQDGGA